ncbi:MAG: response regulator, partial [Lachnospiraceae bacterium]|nr:response regulator [Lachnospiraceae bacterium]
YVMYVWVKRNSDGSASLLNAIEELKEVENRKDDFLANVNHEIRTPINTICGISEIILKEDLPDNIREDIVNIQLAGRNLMTAVSDILDFSELQSGNIALEEEVYNITSTINDVINMATARKNDKQLELIVDCDATLPSVLLGDEKKIRRVMMNLVDNAIKFTDSGFVSISIGYRKEAYGINLMISVKDSGIGMDESGLEQMFVSFNQVDASRKRQEGGLGLGLAISQALVHKMGGVITVKSRIGRGSSFKFVVPQKVLDETPIATIDNKTEVNVAVYIDMEQFDMVAIRDEYSNSIMNMVDQLKGKCHICRNFAELQRREKIDDFSHVFISMAEYRRDKKYFDELSDRTKLVVILDRFEEKEVDNKNILKIVKPFYIQTIVRVLNGLYDAPGKVKHENSGRFVTKGVHVLVVDDNRMNLRVIEGLLTNYRIKVTSAMSGAEALEKIVADDYDFVFMDHMMPEMDGVETMRRIRRIPGTYYQRVPIIALTANAVAGTREMMLNEGFDDFLEKPIERSVLERVLKRHIIPERIIYGEDISDESKAEDGNAAKDDESLAALGIDVSKGIFYCNGEENFFNVLKGYCADGDEIGKFAVQSFEKQDWKNYTIAVHGIKGAMRSIGADVISERAALLEQAGKKGLIDYILENHEAFMKAYNGFFEKLRKSKFINQNAEGTGNGQEEVSELPVLEDSEFERIVSEMEQVMYLLDGEKLAGYVAELQKYQYGGKELKELLEPIYRKIEMSDYISAVENVVRIKNKLSDRER